MFQTVEIDINAQLDGWTHASPVGPFICHQTGRYLIEYDAIVWPDMNVGTYNAAIRATKNGVEIPGSLSTIRDNQRIRGQEITRAYIESFNNLDAMLFQWAATTTALNLFINNSITGITKSNFAVTVTRIN
ncbi:MAG: hypothetical protein AMXMBFR12_06860 [Candidatus Babeliales bacterium]